MKKFFISTVLCLAGIIASAQFVYKIKGDSILMTNDSCNTELILENSTKNICGFLFNKGKGRTEFRSALIKLNDSTYLVGCDTLHLHSGAGGGGITADNGLTANTPTNVRLGGTLLQSTAIGLENHNFSILNGENRYFEIEPTGDRTFKIGDIDNANNGHRFEINDNVGAFNLKSGSSYWLQISTSSNYSILETFDNAIALTGADRKVSMGDVYASGNGTKIILDDIASKTSITKALKLTNYGSGTYSGTVSKYLAVDASGNVIETIPAGANGWSLTGNSGLTEGTNFLGTTSNVSLLFKVNNIQSGKIDVANSNTSLGYRSLLNNTSGTNNTAIGYDALYFDTSGFSNTAIGRNALQHNTSGNENIAVGVNALVSSTTGNDNTAIGVSALSSNTTGFNNTATGYISMASNTTGYFNTASGYQTLNHNTTGTDNTADGAGALYSNTIGAFNTAAGSGALGSNTSGIRNIGTGYYAGFDNISGSQNIFIGYNTGLGITTGSYNTIIGSNVTGLSSSLSGNIILADGSGIQRIRIDGNGRTGIGLTSPTASLHLPAGTASSNTAPLKFTAGTLLATTEAGTVEYDGSHLYFTASDAGSRYQLDQQGGAAGYSTVRENGTALAQQTNLNFGYGATATNNSGLSRTDVDVDLSNSETFLTSDVTLTANTYSDAVSFSLAAGTWMISGNATVESPNNTAQRVTYKLWDGTTVYQAGEAACNSMGNNTKGYVSVPVSSIVVLTGTTTVKLSIASTAASLIKATPGDNSTGTTNKATSIRAVRIK